MCGTDSIGLAGEKMLKWVRRTRERVGSCRVKTISDKTRQRAASGLYCIIRSKKESDKRPQRAYINYRFASRGAELVESGRPVFQSYPTVLHCISHPILHILMHLLHSIGADATCDPKSKRCAAEIAVSGRILQIRRGKNKLPLSNRTLP